MLTLPYAILMTEEWKRDQGAGVGLGPGPPGLQAGPPLSEGVRLAGMSMTFCSLCSFYQRLWIVLAPTCFHSCRLFRSLDWKAAGCAFGSHPNAYLKSFRCKALELFETKIAA